MGSKDDKWHQTLYEMLMDYLDERRWYGTESEKNKKSIATINLILCSDGIYRKGKDCYFPTTEIEEDSRYPRVAKRVYISGKERKEKAFKFLNEVGVREVDDKVEIEAILEENYLQDAIDKKDFRPDINHIRLFAEFVKKHPEHVEIFREYYIFKLEGSKWGKPRAVYLDAPFMATGLREWHEALGESRILSALSDEYEKCDIKVEEIGRFAEKLGASISLSIEKTGFITKEDFSIPQLRNFLSSPSVSKSQLVWRTIIKLDTNWSRYSKAHLGRDRSKLVDDLITAKWVPQKTVDEGYEFVHPRDAKAERLPEGFEYQAGWQWLHDIEFGLSIQEQQKTERQEQERQTEAYKQKEEVARELGFDSPEEAVEMARLKKEDLEGYKQWKERSSTKKERPTFPVRLVDNPEQRQKNLDKRHSAAPRKKYVERPRSTRVTKNKIDPNTWLRKQYINEAAQMICQICEEEMPFKKRDGEYYFEAVELFTEDVALPKEDEAQYLALCPVCAAKYKEFVKNDRSEMIDLREAIINAKDCEIPVTLGDTRTSIHFVETHCQDVKGILARRKNIY
jgi:hypothetical protein